jgi:hypothetical protein
MTIQRIVTSMNDAALSVHLVELQKNLFCDLFDEWHGNTFVLRVDNMA